MQTMIEKKKLKAFKTFEDLFSDGHVQQLEFNPLSKDDNACLFHAKVKPTQRESTYLKNEFYDSWFALDKSDGYGITGHCECKGGADGACRRIAAALYELEAFEKFSCTEGENLWMKRPTCHDIPLPMTSLSVVKPTFGMINQDEKVLPNINDYDLRYINQRHALLVGQKREFGKELQKISSNIQVFEILLEEDIHDDDVSIIQEATSGQYDNKLWFAMRVGLLTASNFQKAVDYIDTSRKPAQSFINFFIKRL